ncbi:MAG: hypothetical protein NT154_33150 [Verrucomicrobia bacterium]|nr:hypothetical protein [Verrucomicrobiota bacterium]
MKPTHLRASWVIALLVASGCPLPCLAQDARAVAGGSTTDAALAEHLAVLAQKVPKGFTMLRQPPFIVLGDESPEVVRRRATQTVKWATDKLKQDYFQHDPQEIIDIWLFRDDVSYTNHARLLFGDTPTTRFGYYSAPHHALIMNIGTGGGTLVHEIVHPFMRANFPNCPAWFNEGLASLYEASAERNGHIQGLINWRFKGLEKAIKEGRTISFQKLTSMTEGEFYGGDGYSQYYAQARYLCYYLQEKRLLVEFYHEFVAAARTDPTGFATLKRVLGESDMQAFKQKWEKFVLGLRGG